MAGYTERYFYKAGKAAKQTTSLLEKFTTNRQNTKYVYDANGNITAVYEYENGEYVLTERYEYDDLNQLTRADIRDTGKTTLYTYDAGGNITSRDEYAYTTEEISGSSTSHKAYGYGNTSWKDLLTSYDGQTITSDGMGNPLNYRDGITFTWKNGRQLASSKVGTIETTYNYDISGNRVYRAGGGFRHTYSVVDGVTLGEKIVFVGNGTTHYMEYMRDENGDVYGFIYDGSTYFLEKNALGDVKYLLDGSGNVLAKYVYDAYGKVVSVVDANGNAITDWANVAHLNPFRYRSYCYDFESGLYYLKSRYYDPVLCRFVNADNAIGQVGNVQGTNMFAYCFNNPVNMSDPTGNWPKWIENAVNWANEHIINPIKNLFSPSKQDNLVNDSSHDDNRRPSTGEPGSTFTAPNGDTRTYGPDGKPQHDYDHNDHGRPDKHPHDPNGGHNHDWENGVRGPAYDIVCEPVIGVALIAVCVIGIAIVAADDATGVGVIDDFLFGPLGAGVGEGMILIFD